MVYIIKITQKVSITNKFYKSAGKINLGILKNKFKWYHSLNSNTCWLILGIINGIYTTIQEAQSFQI